jgi:hypothetical protein
MERAGRFFRVSHGKSRGLGTEMDDFERLKCQNADSSSFPFCKEPRKLAELRDNVRATIAPVSVI